MGTKNQLNLWTQKNFKYPFLHMMHYRDVPKFMNSQLANKTCSFLLNWSISRGRFLVEGPNHVFIDVNISLKKNWWSQFFWGGWRQFPKRMEFLLPLTMGEPQKTMGIFSSSLQSAFPWWKTHLPLHSLGVETNHQRFNVWSLYPSLCMAGQPT